MIELQRWQCSSQSCRNSALGVGSPIGLRAIGWKVEMMDNGVFPRGLMCPLHFQEEAITSPKERIEASHGYALFHQRKLLAPYEGHPTRRRGNGDSQVLPRVAPGPG